MSAPQHGEKVFDPSGTVLITGGTGTLGALLARHLVLEHGVGHLLLASRRGPDAPGALGLRAELESLGADVTLAACDAAERGELAGLLGMVAREHPLPAVVHAASVIDDGVIGSLTAGRLDRVLSAKADATWHLHELTEHLQLPAFVLFSSAAGVLGGPGQGNYAAANAFVDALAAHRRARGLAGTSIAWGLWEDVSELTGALEEIDRSRLARSGIGALSSEHGLELFDAALGAGDAALSTDPRGAGRRPHWNLPSFHRLRDNGSVVVKEIDETNSGPIRVASVPPPAPGFHLLARVDVDGMIAYRFVSPVPRRLSEAALARAGHALTLASNEVFVPAGARG